MTHPLFLVPEVRMGPVTVVGQEGHHAAAVRRVRSAERVDLTDGEGTLGRAVVLDVARGAVSLEVTEVVDESPPTPRVSVVQALLKGEAGERAVGLMTQAGVDRVVPWQSSRVVARWDGDRGARGRRRWTAVSREAAKQAHRARFPEVTQPVATPQVLELIERAGWALCLHEKAGLRLAAATPPAAVTDVLLVVGPEGGLTDEEVTAFATAGAAVLRLGPTVLRSESAGIAALSVVQSLVGRW